MKEKYVFEDLSIKFSVLKKLPPECRFLALVKTEDMDQKERTAILVLFRDKQRELRKAYFCIETGEYLGDAFIETHLRVR